MLAVAINRRRRRTGKVARGEVSIAEGVVIVSLLPRRSRSVVVVVVIVAAAGVVAVAITKEERDTVEDSDLTAMQRVLLLVFIMESSLKPVWLFRDLLSVAVVIQNHISVLVGRSFIC